MHIWDVPDIDEFYPDEEDDELSIDPEDVYVEDDDDETVKQILKDRIEEEEEEWN